MSFPFSFRQELNHFVNKQMIKFIRYSSNETNSLNSPSVILPDLELIINTNIDQSCNESEKCFSEIIDQKNPNYGWGTIITNDSIPFGIVKGKGCYYSFLSGYDILDNKGKILALRGGIYRIENNPDSLKDKIVDNMEKGVFGIIEIKKLFLSYDRMIKNRNLKPNFHFSEKFDAALSGASNYLKTGEGNYKLIK